MTMTRRRNSINIYDYPEHLNPFREDVDEDYDKFNTTGRRRSSFRANAWAMFSGNKGKSKTSEDINPPSQSAASRFMTWTPKLLRRSFRRSSPSRTTSQWDRPSQNNSQITLRSSTSRTSLPPSGSSHSSLHSSRSRSMLPPSSSPPHSLPPRPTSPPYRPAPPNFRPQLSPSQQSTENAVNSDTTPVPPRRRALYTAAPPGTSAGERPTEDEVKYLQQGAKPKKKRRAPLPPGPPPSKSPGDIRPVNSNQESEASLTSSVTSSSIGEPTSHEQSVPASPELKVAVQDPETQPEKEEPESKLPENDEKVTPENTEISASKDSPTEQQNGALEETPKLENDISDSQESSNTNKDETDAQEQLETQENEDKDITEVQNEEKKTEEKEMEDKKTEEKEMEEKKTEEKEMEEKKTEENKVEDKKMEEKKMEDNKTEEKPMNGTDHHKGSLENLKVEFDVVLHISEEDLRDKDPPIQNGNHSESDVPVNHNVEHIHENGVTEMDDSVKSNSHVKEEEKELKLHNGENGLNESDHSESETKLNDVNKKRSPLKTPEPKPRTILPITKDM